MATQRIEKPGLERGVEAGRVTKQKSRANSLAWLTPYLFLAPYLTLFVLFVAIPAVLGVWMSLHEYDYLLEEKPWVGLENYTQLFNSDSTYYTDYWKGMKATALFTLYSVPPLLILPLFLAMLMNKKFKGRSFFRAVYFAPYVLGVAVVALLWRYILDNNIGLFNYFIDKVGIDADVAWTSSNPWAWIALVIVTVWWTLGFNTVIYLAGLQDIGKELYEAAKVDGAGAVRRFWHITLPGLRPVLVLVVVLTLLSSANMFGQAYLITEGQPANETRTAIMYIAEQGLQQFKMGAAAAMSFILAFFLMLTSAIIFAVSRRFED
jgi:multiple sugar transport system permease protein